MPLLDPDQIAQAIARTNKWTISFLKAVCRDLKKVYLAPNDEEAMQSLDDFSKTWNDKYSMIRKSRERRWNDLSEFFTYPEEIRKVIYTTNASESLNLSLRKVTKNRATFSTDDSIYTVISLAIHKAAKEWTMPISNWDVSLDPFSIMFPEFPDFCT